MPGSSGQLSMERPSRSLYNRRVQFCDFDRVFVRPFLRPLPHQRILRAATDRERGRNATLLIIPACFARGSERSITGPNGYCWRYIKLEADRQRGRRLQPNPRIPVATGQRPVGTSPKENCAKKAEFYGFVSQRTKSATEQ